MKSFGEWMHSDPLKREAAVIERPAEAAEKRKLQHELDHLRELVTDNFSDLRWRENIGYEFRCCCCENWRELEDVEHYTPDRNYCGGSPRCCP